MTARVREEKRHRFDKTLLKGVLGSNVAPDMSRGFKKRVCVCSQVFRGVDVVTLPAAVMLLAIQEVVRRL